MFCNVPCFSSAASTQQHNELKSAAIRHDDILLPRRWLPQSSMAPAACLLNSAAKAHPKRRERLCLSSSWVDTNEALLQFWHTAQRIGSPLPAAGRFHAPTTQHSDNALLQRRPGTKPCRAAAMTRADARHCVVRSVRLVSCSTPSAAAARTRTCADRLDRLSSHPKKGQKAVFSYTTA